MQALPSYIRVIREIPGEWLRVGETYAVTPGYCRNTLRGSGTPVTSAVLRKAIARGDVVPVEV